MTQMLGLICVVQYTFAAVCMEVLGQKAPRDSWYIAYIALIYSLYIIVNHI